MNIIRRYRTIRKALSVCDGVIEVAENDMLAKGQYVFEEVSNPRLRARGSICGGHQACIVGSMFLAHGDLPEYDEVDHTPIMWGGIFSKRRDEWLSERPGLALAYRAINRAAKTTIDEYYSEWSDRDPNVGPYKGWGEYFFERVLEGEDRENVASEVIGVANLAKRLIRERVVS